jgi:hypothetical protein
MIIGGRTFQIGLPKQHGVVLLDRGQGIGDRRSGVGVLLPDVAGDGGVVAGRVRVCGGIRCTSQSISSAIIRARTSVLPTSRFRRPP